MLHTWKGEGKLEPIASKYQDIELFGCVHMQNQTYVITDISVVKVLKLCSDCGLYIFIINQTTARYDWCGW